MVKNLRRTLALMIAVIMICSSTFTTLAEGVVGAAESETGVAVETEETVAADEEKEVPPQEEKTEAVKEEAVSEPATEVVEAEKSEITSQPKDVSVRENDEAEFALEVSGELKSCQWQMAKTKTSLWTDLSRCQYGSSDTLKIRALAKYNKRYFRCIVTFKDGTKAVSEAARLNIVANDSYPAVSFAKSTSEVRVSVEAEEGTFPAGTSMSVEKVRVADIEDAVVEALGEDVEGMLAVDITFKNADGQEIQPKKEVKVSLAPTYALDENAEYSVVHVKEDAKTEELVCDVLGNEKIDEIGADGAVFDTDSFSTYTLAWTQTGAGGGNRTATIHVGYLNSNNNNFTELTTAEASLDTSGDSIDLKAFTESVIDTSKYAYIGARYSATANTGSVNELSGHTITKNANGSWQAQVVTGNNNTITSTAIANGSHIYIFCEDKGAGSYTPPTPEGSSVNPESVKPNFAKTVTKNDDGTYTIKLDITGHQAPVQEGQGANVIIVFDTTKSMRYDMDGDDPGSYSSTSTTTRMYAAKAALRTLITTLNPGDGTGGTNAVNVNFIQFNNGNTSTGNWTSNQNTLNTTINGLTPVTGSGTNWEEGLVACENLLATIPNNANLKNNKTYVIFVTDGDPNKCQEANLSDYHYNAAAAAHAQDNANNVANNSYLYGVFCGASAGADRLETLITTANGKQTIAATSQTDLEAAFENIGKIITSNLGSHSVNMDDGLPNLASIQHTVSGEATDFKYYKNDVEWTGSDVPQATYDSSNGVVWDLSSAGTLDDNTKYSVEFTIWPTQASYDLIADLNNGIKQYEPGSEDSITDAQRAQIDKNADGSYTLKTNTHLYASYVNEADGGTYNVPNVPYTGQNMPLPTEPISVKKIWPDNMLDSYGAAAYRDKDTGETKYATEIQLTLEREGTKYLDFVVSKDGPDGDPNTTDDNWTKDDLFVSVGFMTVKNGVVDIKEPGHDYQIIEPPEFMYYWDLISDVYHPMVINGTATVLVYDPDITAPDVTNGIYEIPKNSGRFYKTKSDTSGNTLEASNYRRSNLNLSKVIPEGADADSIFTIKAKVTDTYSTDGYVWFSAWDNKAGGLVTDEWVTGTGVVAQGDGYFYAPNGTELTMNIKTNWNVRFLNLYHGSTFSFEETGMPNNFEFDKVEADTQYDIMLDSNKNWYTIETTGEGEAAVQTGKITGTITEPNNNYNITYTNKLKPEFYIYHSGVDGDGNLETIQIPPAGTTPTGNWNSDGTYNLHAHTTQGTLYGGYYLNYQGKGDYKDDGVKGTTGVAYTGMNYQDWASCEPQSENGKKITPVAGETYYIKEVPTYYLRNYHQINYVRDGGKLMGLYLISAIDDLNYKETGLTLRTTDDKVSNVCSQMTFKNSATNKSVVLKANSVFNSIGINGEGSDKEYLTYFDATKTNYFAVGEFTVLPYWITPDGIKVNGISTRTINITSMTKKGITKTDN